MKMSDWNAPTEKPRIGVFICHCGANIAGTLDITKLVEFTKTQPDVVCVMENRYTCADRSSRKPMNISPSRASMARNGSS